MGPVFNFSRKSKLKIDFKIILPRPNQFTKNKKIFSRNTPPSTASHFYLIIYNKVPYDFFCRAPSMTPTPRQFVGPWTYVQGPDFTFCAPCTKIKPKLCATLPIDFFPKVCYNKSVRKREARQ